MTSIALPDKAFPKGLDDISKCFGLTQTLVRIKGPRSLRLALEVSQPELGRLLGFYLGGHAYSAATIATWERIERQVRLPERYAMTDKTRGGYRQLLADVIELAGSGRFRLRARMGPRVWRFGLERDCGQCGRPFIMRRSDAVRCRRCVGRSN